MRIDSTGAPGAASVPKSETAAPAKPALAQAGGIGVTPDGRIIMDGKKYNLIALLATVQQDARDRAKDVLQITMDEIKQANRLAKAATEWLNSVRGAAVDPAKHHHSKVLGLQLKPAHDKFVARYGMEPDRLLGGVYRLNPNHHGHHRSHYHQWGKKTMDYAVESVKSYISKTGSKQEKLQIDIQRYSHAIDEVATNLRSVEKAYLDTTSQVDANI